MAIEILAGITDDSHFISLLNSMVERLAVLESPTQFWVIQIDNWFDHKWLRFSGNGAIASNILSGETQNANHPFVIGITPTGHCARSGVVDSTQRAPLFQPALD